MNFLANSIIIQLHKLYFVVQRKIALATVKQARNTLFRLIKIGRKIELNSVETNAGEFLGVGLRQ